MLEGNEKLGSKCTVKDINEDDEKDNSAKGKTVIYHVLPTEEETTSYQFDEGAEFIKLHPEFSDYTEKEERSFLLKLDLMLLPLLTVTIMLSSADKIVISNAALYGMVKDLELSGSRYSWTGSIFFFGYLLMEPLANYLLQKYRTAKVLGISYVIWSIILGCIAATQNFPGIATLRFFMGMGESFIFPGVNAIVTMFYTKKEQPIRMSIIFSCLSSLVSCGVSIGISKCNTSLATWRVIFSTLSGASAVVGCLLIAFLPDSPHSTYLLKTKEKYISVSRLQKNKTGIKNQYFKKYQLIEGILDWKTWIAALFILATQVPNGALTTFATQIVSGLGYSKEKTLLLGMPTGVMMSVSSILITLISYLFHRRYIMIVSIFFCLVPLVCCILIMKLKNSTGLLISYYFFYFYWGPYPIVLSVINSNTAGQTKKTTINTICFLSYCLANIIAPQFFISSEAPGYKTGYRALLAFSSVATLSAMVYSFGCFMENKRRDSLYGPPGLEASVTDDLDITDKEKEQTFRYTW